MMQMNNGQPQSPQFDRWVKIERAILVIGGLVFVALAFYLMTFAVGRFLLIPVSLMLLGVGTVWFSRQEALIRKQLATINAKRQLALGVMALSFGIIRLAVLNDGSGGIDPMALIIGVLLLMLGLWSLWRAFMASRVTANP